jgi:phosphoserine aminotransferase
MERVFNFSAGPSVLPEEVLRRAGDEISNYKGSGMSVMEMSHRSKIYEEIIGRTEFLFRSILKIPENYKVLFLQGGATLQFAMLPMNLLGEKGRADYVITGHFSEKAYEEARCLGKTVSVAATTKDEKFARIPEQRELKLDPKADYVHICANNTIYGSAWKYIPATGGVPLAVDMSSCILSEPIDISRYGIIYAGAQKNVAPAGLTLVVVREDLLRDPPPGTPAMLNYAVQAKSGSMYNTPPCWPIYIAMLVLEWLESLGGLEAMRKRNREKADILYSCLDSLDFYKTFIRPEDRSMMNVTFSTGSEALDERFIKESTARGFSNLKGHKVLGGMRASIYNAMPRIGVEKLTDFMREFAEANR